MLKKKARMCGSCFRNGHKSPDFAQLVAANKQVSVNRKGLLLQMLEVSVSFSLPLFTW